MHWRALSGLQGSQASRFIVRALVAPVPTKLRLTVARMRGLAMAIGEGVGRLLTDLNRQVEINCRYRLSTDYLGTRVQFRTE